MGIGSIGSVSFYQQDQNYWQQQQAQSNAQSADDSLIDVMGQAEVTEAKGLASIANGTALKRVDSQISSLVQSELGSTSTSSSSSTTNGSSTSAATGTGSSSASATPASGIGTVPLTTTATLSSLGFLPGGTFSVDDGTNITTYTSTGDDTVADLIDAINSGPAFVTAALNGNGKLTITARDDKETITVEGSGIDATALGFGNNNNSFSPTAPAASPSASTSTTASSTAANTSSATTTSKSSSSTTVSSIGQEIASSAASILSASGVSGTLVDMLA